MKLPQEYLTNIQKLFKDRCQDYLDSFDRKAFTGIRINSSKISREDFLKISPFSLQPVPWCNEGFYCDENPGRHPYYHAGLYYIQEPSAMAPAEILPVECHDVILDACSAPGGKATRLAAKLNGSGLLVSNDLSASRQKATLRNIERFGFRNCFVIAEDTAKLKERFPEYFDKILVDAPCSGEGMFRKDPLLINSWLERNSEYYYPIQKEILSNCVEMLKTGGQLLYSTCTFSPAENEEVIQYCLNRYPEMELLDIHQKYPYFEKGVFLKECARLYPFNLDGEGHFVALLKKKGQSSKTLSIPFTSFHSPSLNEFMSLCKLNVSGYHYEKIGEAVCLVPDIPFDNSSIRTLRSGLLLGRLKKGLFEPAQSLAMALRADQFAQVLKLEEDDIRVLKYLKGETISADEKLDGWLLLCLKDYPLGFARAINGKIKNKIDPGWRMP